MATFVDQSEYITECTFIVHKNIRITVVSTIAVCSGCLALVIITVYPAVFKNSFSEYTDIFFTERSECPAAQIGCLLKCIAASVS
jgi:hypothetical protein